MSLFGIIFSVVGALGVAGAVAFFVFAPVVAAESFRAALAIVGRIWGTRIGAIAITAAVCLAGGLLYGDHFGEKRVRAAWKIANDEAQAKADKADADIAALAEKLDEQTNLAEIAADAATEKARNDYLADLEKRGAAVCAATDDDVSRLRSLR